MGKLIINNFTHLHCHTSIGSMQDSMVSVDDLFKKAAEMDQGSIAITDHGTMSAMFDARKASLKHGVKFIPGIESYFVDDVSLKPDKKDIRTKRRHLILLAKNESGYRNLLKLNYEGFVNCQYIPILNKVFSRIDWDLLEQYHENIICLTACSAGLLAEEMFKINEDNEWDEEACHINVFKTASRLKNIFGEDLYLELQPHAFKKYKKDRKTEELELTKSGDPVLIADQTYINRKLLSISRELDIPIVAACDVHYLEKEDASVHDMLMAINDKKPLSDKNRHRYDIEEFYMKTGDKIVDYFTELVSRKVALELCNNTVGIANKCDDSTYIDVSDIRFPKFNVSVENDYQDFLKWRKKKNYNASITEVQAFMRYRCIKGFKKEFGHLRGEERKAYMRRIENEINVLEGHQFCSYMLITADLISEAKRKKIRVGPGRGSVGGCFVAYLLGIHEVIPMQYGLLFERFHNKEKTSYPDIDTDFSSSGRDQIEQYAVKKYGNKNVAHVSNLSTMTPKVVIKDLARSLELGGNKREAFKIANEITDTISIDTKSFDGALKDSEKLRSFCVQYPKIEEYGRKLVGLEKTFATHAAGIVISDIDLSTYVPLRYDKKGSVSVQYEKNRCEKVGLIKMDLLGLEHLKVIDSTIENVHALGMECPDTDELAPFNDKNVWNMISKGQTVCVFQMGSHHMRSLCKRIKPQNIEDLSLVNALGRPSGKSKGGGEDLRDVYIARRDGKKKVSFEYKCLKEPLKETLGICVYEEQLSKLAKHVAGWDLNKADVLRKFTKLKGKDPKLATKIQNDFVEDTAKHSNLTKSEAFDIWEKVVEPFSGYGFNKAHGIFYSLNGYHTAYYKYHYPAPFMAAVLRSEVEKSSSNENKIKIYKKEATRMGIKIVAPDINKSDEYFSVIDNSTIAMGLVAVKGVGEKAVQNIIETRKEHRFVSFSDFLYRTNSRFVRKNVIQALAKAGCFDSFGIKRKAVFTQYANVRIRVNKYMEIVATSGIDPWDLILEREWTETEKQLLGNEEWTKKEILVAEGETLGDYLSGNINDVYSGFFTNKGVIPLNKIKKMADGTPVRVEAIIESIAQPKHKSGRNKGHMYGNCTIIDINKDNITMKIWSDKWKKVKDKIITGRPIRAICRINVYKDNYMLVLNTLEKVG